MTGGNMLIGISKFLDSQFWVQAFHAFLQTCRRFPLVMLCLVVISIPLVPLIGSAGAIWFLAAGLFSESHRWTLFKRNSLALPIFTLVCWHFVAIGSPAHSTWTLYFAIALAITFAAYLFRRNDNASFWYFNFQLAVALCFSVLSALIFCGGLSLSLKSISYLFEMKISSSFYSRIWIFGWSFFAPVYFLVNVPSQFDYQQSDCEFPRGVYFIQNYVLIPLSLTYMVILYAYFIKILLQWELPRGNLGLMISVFGVIGIFTHLMIFPLHNRNKPLLGWFYRNFYKMMIVPLGLLILAISVRISQYGLTEPRYIVVICATWFSILIACFLFQGTEFQLRTVTVSLAVLALAVSFGPWQLDKLPVSHQFSRLQTLLIKENMLINNQYQAPKNQPDFAIRKSISSTVNYLITHDGGDKIRPWFSNNEAIDNILNRCENRRCFQGDGAELVKQMGIDFVRPKEKKQNETFRISLGGDNYRYIHENTFIPLADFDYAIPVKLYFNRNLIPRKIDQVWPAHKINELNLLLNKDNKLDILFGKERQVSVDLNTITSQFSIRNHVKVPAEGSHKLILDQSENGLKVRLYAINLNGWNKEGDLQITNIQGTLLIKFID